MALVCLLSVIVLVDLTKFALPSRASRVLSSSKIKAELYLQQQGVQQHTHMLPQLIAQQGASLPVAVPTAVEATRKTQEIERELTRVVEREKSRMAAIRHGKRLEGEIALRSLVDEDLAEAKGDQQRAEDEKRRIEGEEALRKLAEADLAATNAKAVEQAALKIAEMGMQHIQGTGTRNEEPSASSSATIESVRDAAAVVHPKPANAIRMADEASTWHGEAELLEGLRAAVTTEVQAGNVEEVQPAPANAISMENETEARLGDAELHEALRAVATPEVDADVRAGPVEKTAAAEAAEVEITAWTGEMELYESLRAAAPPEFLPGTLEEQNELALRFQAPAGHPEAQLNKAEDIGAVSQPDRPTAISVEDEDAAWIGEAQLYDGLRAVSPTEVQPDTVHPQDFVPPTRRNFRGSGAASWFGDLRPDDSLRRAALADAETSIVDDEQKINWLGDLPADDSLRGAASADAETGVVDDEQNNRDWLGDLPPEDEFRGAASADAETSVVDDEQKIDLLGDLHPVENLRGAASVDDEQKNDWLGDLPSDVNLRGAASADAETSATDDEHKEEELASTSAEVDDSRSNIGFAGEEERSWWLEQVSLYEGLRGAVGDIDSPTAVKVMERARHVPKILKHSSDDEEAWWLDDAALYEGLRAVAHETIEDEERDVHGTSSEEEHSYWLGEVELYEALRAVAPTKLLSDIISNTEEERSFWLGEVELYRGLQAAAPARVEPSDVEDEPRHDEGSASSTGNVAMPERQTVLSKGRRANSTMRNIPEEPDVPSGLPKDVPPGLPPPGLAPNAPGLSPILAAADNRLKVRRTAELFGLPRQSNVAAQNHLRSLLHNAFASRSRQDSFRMEDAQGEVKRAQDLEADLQVRAMLAPDGTSNSHRQNQRKLKVLEKGKVHHAGEIEAKLHSNAERSAELELALASQMWYQQAVELGRQQVYAAASAMGAEWIRFLTPSGGQDYYESLITGEYAANPEDILWYFDATSMPYYGELLQAEAGLQQVSALVQELQQMVV